MQEDVVAGTTVIPFNHDNNADNGLSYQQLLQQREEENRQEVERLTAEIRALKLQLLQLTNGKFEFGYTKIKIQQLSFVIARL